VATRHNRKIVGWIADPRVFPIDDSQLVRLAVPQDVLGQQIPVEKHSRPIHREVTPYPLCDSCGICVMPHELGREGFELSENMGATICMTRKEMEAFQRRALNGAGDPSYYLDDRRPLVHTPLDVIQGHSR